MRSGEGYPRQPSYPADSLGGQPGGLGVQRGGLGGQPGGPVGYPGGPVGRPGGPGGRVQRAWPTWWIAPYLGGALAVLVVFAGLQLTVLRHPAGHASTAASSPAVAAPTGPVPAQMFPDALFKRLTKDIQGKDEKDFLSLVAPGALPAVQTWWDNMQAIGFSTGLIMPTDKTDQVSLDNHGDGTATVLAGTHNALDPLDNSKHPSVPLERYQLGLHFASANAIGQITAWKPLGNAPWDQGKLYVRKDANVVVAGPAADSATVDETLPLAQAAAAYDVGLINHVHNTDLRQSGFVVFVSGDPTVRSRWFSTTKQPAGWAPASPDSGLTAQLPGPGASADTKWSVGNIASDTTGGARVVITPFEDQTSATSANETEELVARFALDILSASNQSLGGSLFPAATPPAWAIEGFAVAFEAAYESNTNPTPDSYSFSALTDALKQLPASYKTGALPTADQLYGGDTLTQPDWRVVAASVYAYIAAHAGMGQLLASAELMWTAEPDPRANVLKSTDNKGNLVFFGKDTIQSGWTAYLANPTDQAPAIGPSGV